jgi:hypothetical protein
MIQELPKPAQRYLRYAGVVGTYIPTTVTISQKGQIRKDTRSVWMTIESQEYYSIPIPGFVWLAYMPRKYFPFVIGRDEYVNAKGSILMKCLAIIPVANQKGKKMNEASLLRYLNEMMWFPGAFLKSNISWNAIDEYSVEVSISDHDIKASAILHISDEGKLTNFTANRHNSESGKIEVWETPITSYGVFNGLRLPNAGTAVYKREAGDLEYIRLTITDIRYG